MARQLRAIPSLLALLLVGVVACDPKTVDYEITVKNDYPGTRVGIYTTTGTTPLATTTKATDKLIVQTPFKEGLVARFVDTSVRKVALDGILHGPDKRTLAKEGKRVPMNVFASNVHDDLLENVEIIVSGSTDEPITVGDVPVDSKAVAPGKRLRVPVRSGEPVKVKIGSEAPVAIAIEPRKEGVFTPGGFVWIDPSGTTCLQMRYVAYGAVHLIPGRKGPSPPVKLAPAKIHAFTREDAPDILVDEEVPDSITGSGIGNRKVLERCTPARKN
jgi:hypothetical protein